VRRPVALAAIAALFLSGVLVGVLGTHLFYLRHLREPGWLVKTGAHLLAADLRRQLDLTPPQQRQVDAILADAQRDAVAVRREVMPRMLAVLDRSQSRIEAILTPQQREKLHRLRLRRGDRLRRLLAGG
jgi:Spy/CpxP family protein refolding chaperone